MEETRPAVRRVSKTLSQTLRRSVASLAPTRNSKLVSSAPADTSTLAARRRSYRQSVSGAQVAPVNRDAVCPEASAPLHDDSTGTSAAPNSVTDGVSGELPGLAGLQLAAPQRAACPMSTSVSTSPPSKQRQSTSVTICQWLIAHPAFGQGVIALIIVNTALLAAEHEDQPQSLTNLNAIALPALSLVFLCEVAVRMTAYGIVAYFFEPFNLFDLMVVLLSMLDLFTSTAGLSVLRSLRLLRVLAAMRFSPTMRRQLSIMVKTLDSVATFSVLVLIFIFMGAVLGMHLFGDR